MEWMNEPKNMNSLSVQIQHIEHSLSDIQSSLPQSSLHSLLSCMSFEFVHIHIYTHITSCQVHMSIRTYVPLSLYDCSCCQALTHLLYIFSNWNRLFVKYTCVMITVVLIIGNTYKLSSHAQNSFTHMRFYENCIFYTCRQHLLMKEKLKLIKI